MVTPIYLYKEPYKQFSKEACGFPWLVQGAVDWLPSLMTCSDDTFYVPSRT